MAKRKAPLPPQTSAGKSSRRCCRRAAGASKTSTRLTRPNADTPRAFADAVLQLLNEPALAARLARHGRNWVMERHSWDRSAGLLADAYSRLIGSDEKTVLRGLESSMKG